MTNTHLDELLVGQPPDVKAEILHINTKARPLALQIALLIPFIAALLGLAQGLDRVEEVEGVCCAPGQHYPRRDQVAERHQSALSP